MQANPEEFKEENKESKHDEDEISSSTPNITSVDEAMVMDLVSKCKKDKSTSHLVSMIGSIFSNPEYLMKSFLKPEAKNESDIDKNVQKKEKIEDPNQDPNIKIDLDSVRRSLDELFKIADKSLLEVIFNSLSILFNNLQLDIKYAVEPLDPNLIHVFLICMEFPILDHSELVESMLPALCRSAALLPVSERVRLSKAWSRDAPSFLRSKVTALHQLIALRTVAAEGSVHDQQPVQDATFMMEILYLASVLGGEQAIEMEQDRNTSVEDLFPNRATPQPLPEPSALARALSIRMMRCRRPVLAHSDFYNEPLSENIEMETDFVAFKSRQFSFLAFPFLLTPAARALGLNFDNRERMYSERRINVLHSLLEGASPSPFLRLRVRRDQIVHDALIGLEMAALESTANLKKQLAVEFEGEQGVDEGGVSKEFFQLVIEDIFRPDYGIFVQSEETGNYWFNTTSFENDAQFTLVGIILGLAIYNSVILDIHFSMVLYYKLFGQLGCFSDLKDYSPTLFRSLCELRDYEGDDMESVFTQTFRISYTDIFGTVYNHDLVPNGDNILVNQANKQEFLDLYADFLLNRSVEKQFRALRRGFLLVTGDSPLTFFFRPEEIELLICGEKEFDFSALEETSEYDNGYTAESPVIKNFWELVHELSPEDKLRLLQFITGSDRVPVGGLGRLRLIITRNGSDSSRLPTAQTCFNVLLLPEYLTKEKLKDRLLKAIHYSKGFGLV